MKVLGAGNDEPIVNFNLSVFAVLDIGDLYRDRGLRPGFTEQGGSPLTLVEYRWQDVCLASCGTLAELREDVLGGSDSTARLNQIVWDTDDLEPTGILLSGLVEEDADGNEVRFFLAPEGVDYTVEVTLVARANAAAAQPFVIRRVPVSLQVAVRD